MLNVIIKDINYCYSDKNSVKYLIFYSLYKYIYLLLIYEKNLTGKYFRNIRWYEVRNKKVPNETKRRVKKYIRDSECQNL